MLLLGTTTNAQIDLTAQASAAAATLKYSSIMRKDMQIQTKVKNTNTLPCFPSQAPSARKTAFDAKETVVASNFPVTRIIDLNYLGEGFSGVYTTRSGAVYAVKGAATSSVAVNPYESSFPNFIK